MASIIPGACSCQASDPFAPVAGSESATPAADLWQLVRKSGEFSSLDRQPQVRYEGFLLWLPVLMD